MTVKIVLTVLVVLMVLIDLIFLAVLTILILVVAVRTALRVLTDEGTYDSSESSANSDTNGCAEFWEE